MSKYLTFNDVVFKDAGLLIAALSELGYAQVEQGESLALYGYQGDVRKERAQLVVRRQHIGSASNNLGFISTVEGYVPVISEYDRMAMHQGRFIPALRTAYNQRAIEKITQRLRGTARKVSNTEGMQGQSCADVAKIAEELLGAPSKEKNTPEFYVQTRSNRQVKGQGRK